MVSKMYPFINYRDSIHYRNSCSASIVIAKFLLSLSTNTYVCMYISSLQYMLKTLIHDYVSISENQPSPHTLPSFPLQYKMLSD